MSTPMLPSGRFHAITSMLSSGPPRFRFHPYWLPAHRPASITRSRRNFMLSCRCDSDPTGAVLSGYFAWMHATTCGPVGSAQLPPPPPGGGGGGGGGGAAGVRNACVALQPLIVSLSPARTRQESVVSGASAELLNRVCPEPSLTMPAAMRRPNAWSEAT